jgi:hypothetical protein
MIFVNAPASVRASLEEWRSEARDRVYEVIDSQSDVDWLSGRIATLNQVLALLDGVESPGDQKVFFFDRELMPTPAGKPNTGH